MRGPVTTSIILHTGVVLITYFGLPDFNRSLDLPPPPVFVEMVDEEELAALEANPKPKPEPQKAPPPPPPEPEPAPEPEPVPETEPVPEKAKEPEPPKPVPVVKQPRPPAKRPEPKQDKADEKPKDDLTSVLKTVQKLEDAPKPKPQPEPEEEKQDTQELALADILKNAQKPKTDRQTPRREIAEASELLSSRELDAVKRQISGCWSIQPGARDAENLIVRLRVVMNQNRTVRSVMIVQGNRANPFQEAAERSARAAVIKCSPLRLPPDKYDVWKIINFTFDPKQMFG